MTIHFIVNDQIVERETDPFVLLLDFLRLESGLRGTKQGCREGDCGACSVLVGHLNNESVIYNVINSCLCPLSRVDGCHVVTIEGLNGPELTPVQAAIVTEGATQCGFCTPGLVISLTGYLLGPGSWSSQGAIAAVAGNICRCTGYASIRRAIDLLGKEADLIPAHQSTRLEYLVRHGIIPEYFEDIAARLGQLSVQKSVSHPSLAQQIIAGGTDYFVQQHEQKPSRDYYFTGPPFDQVRLEDGDLCIGAAATIDAVGRSADVARFIPHLSEHLRFFASSQIRKSGTIGGNIVNASPIADMAIILLAFDTEVGISNGSSVRTVPLSRFFMAYKKVDLKPGELVIWFKVRKKDGSLFNYEKVSKRQFLDIASVNTAICIEVEHGMILSARISAGGVAPVPLFLERTSSMAGGLPVTVETARELARCAEQEATPIDDIRGSKWYKARLLRHLVLAHFQVLFGWQEGLL